VFGAKVVVEHRHTLLAGRLAAHTSPLAGLPALVRLLRRHCDAARLGGGLLFDGEWVVMLFEGEAASLAAVLDTLVAAPYLDARLELLVDRTLAATESTPTRWIAGYAEPDLLETLRRQEGDATASTLAFKQALGASDAL
jgi:hypothetical protein